jgi:hypothetical protein
MLVNSLYIPYTAYMVMWTGAVYTFSQNDLGAWTQTARLVPYDSLAASDNMGFSVGLFNDTVAAGAPGDNDDIGTPLTHKSLAMSYRSHVCLDYVSLCVGAVYVYFTSSESAAPTASPTYLNKKNNHDDDDAFSGSRGTLYIALICVGVVLQIVVCGALFFVYCWGKAKFDGDVKQDLLDGSAA